MEARARGSLALGGIANELENTTKVSGIADG